MNIGVEFPRQQISFKKKTKEWGKKCVDWVSDHSYFNYAPVRTSVVNMKINYDLVNGRIHMDDVASTINPSGSTTLFAPDKIQHYPIINNKIDVLIGEASSRLFDWKAVVTNMNSISEIEERKQAEFLESFQQIVEDSTLDESQAQRKMQEMSDYFNYNWQDEREIMANELINHYMREGNYKGLFLDGFKDALNVGEELYMCDIVAGEPTIIRLNPMKLRIYKAGYSSIVEDADIIAYEDYWSPGKIIDAFYDQLSAKEIAWLEGGVDDQSLGPVGAAGNYDDAHGYMNRDRIIGEDGVIVSSGEFQDYFFDALAEMEGGFGSDLIPYDTVGNVRVLRVFWKSRRKIKKVKHYDEETGEELFDFYPENYVVDKDKGEEEEIYWVNEPWEGTKIGQDIYVNIRPRVVRFNTIDNPSRCHFGIVGTIYNFNESKPFSLVDKMKPYSYLYDAVSAKLVDLISNNWGKILEMDLALKPKGWEVEKWLYFARVNKVLLKDSFNEGSKGSATGKLAGGLNNASKGVIDAELGNSIQNNINLLEYIKTSMSDIIGISKQREGNIANRETVGGIERSTLQSSYITEWLFQKHDDTIRRTLNAFLEVCKAAFRGKIKKIRYILSDGSIRVLKIDGNLLCESDYGVLIENSIDTQRLDSKLEMMAQAAIQNNKSDLASIMKLFTSKSPAEKIRIIEAAEKRMSEQNERMEQMKQQSLQQLEQMKQQLELQKMQQQDMLNQRDNETKIEVAKINSQAEYMRLGIYAEENDEELVKAKQEIERDKVSENKRQFDETLKFKREELAKKLEVERRKAGLTNKTKK